MAHSKPHTPKQLLAQIIADNPGVSREQSFKLFMAAIKSGPPEMLEQVLGEGLESLVAELRADGKLPPGETKQ